jgi:cyclohexyl-isocyanide hydratase
MDRNTTLRVGLLCFPRLTQLDLTGPYEVLARLPDTETRLVWKDRNPVASDRGMRIVPDTTMGEAPRFDLILVPGGPGQQDLMEDEQTLDFLRSQAASAQYVASVCTGSLVLAAAGLLQGYRATCHWLSLPLLERLGAIPVSERVVVDGNRITTAGVSAGIDGALRIAAMLRGEAAAQAIQLQIEYDPAPPFAAGSPQRAPKEIVQHVEKQAANLIEARRRTVERVAGRLRQ